MATTNFVCVRCGHNASTKAHLSRHLQSVTPCSTKFAQTSREDILTSLKNNVKKCETIECEWCSKVISKSNYSRHKNVCTSRPPPTPEENTNENAPLSLIMKDTEAYNQLKDAIKQDIMKELASTSNNQPSINNNTIIIQTNNTQNNISVHAFGNEDISHLSHDFLSHCLMNPTKGITNLIDNIHYNTEVPSNHNVRYKSTKQNTMEKFVDAHWTECDASNTLDELIRKGYRILNAHYAEHFMNDPSLMENEMKLRALEKFRFLSDKTSNDYYSIKRDLRLLVKDRTIYVIEAPNTNVQNE